MSAPSLPVPFAIVAIVGLGFLKMEEDVIASYQCQLQPELVDRVFGAIRSVWQRTGWKPRYVIISTDVCVNLFEHQRKKGCRFTSKSVVFEGVEIVCNADAKPGTVTPVLYPEDEMLYGSAIRQELGYYS